MSEMTIRERLVIILCGQYGEKCACEGRPISKFDLCMKRGRLIDAVLDELMEPGEGALRAGFGVAPKPPMRCSFEAFKRQYQGVVINIKAGK